MSIHILSANGLVQDLAANRVTPQEQAVYLTLNFCVWIVPSYLSLFPAPITTEVQSFCWSAWLIQMFCSYSLHYRRQLVPWKMQG